MKPLRDLLRNPDCRLCPLHEDAQSVCLIGDGKYPAKLMLVGEAPGYREDNINKPFAGKAGNLLDGILDVFQLPRSEIFISNSVHCRPPDNRKPTNQEITTCSQEYLTREVRYVKPRVIIALGQVAGQGLLQRKITVTTNRSQLWYTQKPFLPNIPVVVTYHPAAALRNDHLIDYIVKDFELALEVMKNGPPKDVKLDYRLGSIGDVPELEAEARKSGVISVDLETDGFDCYLKNRRIISIQISTGPGKAYYFLWDEAGIKESLRPILEDVRILKVFHNAKFDLKWLRQAGIKVKGPIDDTMVDIHLLDENYPDKSLDAVTTAFTSLKNHKDTMHQYRKTHKCEFRDIPIKIALPYGCGDADGTNRLHYYFKPRIKEENLVALHKHEMRKIRMFVDVETTGAKIDTSIIDDLIELYEKKIDWNQRKLTKYAGEEINPRSPQQIMRLLYTKWKLPALGRPKHFGGPALKNSAEDTLNKLLELDLKDGQRKTIGHVLRLRELSKLLSTYLLGITDYLREDDLIHPNFFLTGTVTGRLSCRDPNLQNIPREGDIKRLFISRYGKEGCIVSVDISQGELRWAAHYSGEPTLVSYFQQGVEDIHRSVAAEILGLPEIEVTKAQRKKAKLVNFGILYGISDYGLYTKNPGDFESQNDAARFRRAWLDKFSGWPSYVNKIRKEVIKNGRVTSDFGRIRHLPIIDPDSQQGKESIRQAVNSPIQGSLCDYTILGGYNSYVRIRRERIPRVHFIAQVHDQWLLDCHLDSVPMVTDILSQEFRHPNFREFEIDLKVPMDIEIEMGPNWKEVKPLDSI